MSVERSDVTYCRRSLPSATVTTKARAARREGPVSCTTGRHLAQYPQAPMKIPACLLFVAALLSPALYSYGGELKFSARIVESSCQMNFSNNGAALDLGSMSTREAHGAKGYTTPQVPFVIMLSDCPPQYPFISLTFQGETDRHDDRLLALAQHNVSSLRGAGVALYDRNENITPPRLIPINTGRSANVATDKYGYARFLFSAAIMADGGPLAPGVSRPVVSVTVNYE